MCCGGGKAVKGCGGRRGGDGGVGKEITKLHLCVEFLYFFFIFEVIFIKCKRFIMLCYAIFIPSNQSFSVHFH